jgi:hypothetical protein
VRRGTASYRRLDRSSSTAARSRKGRNGGVPILDHEMPFGYAQGGVGAVGVEGRRKRSAQEDQTAIGDGGCK